MSQLEIIYLDHLALLCAVHIVDVVLTRDVPEGGEDYASKVRAAAETYGENIREAVAKALCASEYRDLADVAADVLAVWPRGIDQAATGAWMRACGLAREALH